jgi:hypothetical protein
MKVIAAIERWPDSFRVRRVEHNFFKVNYAVEGVAGSNPLIQALRCASFSALKMPGIVEAPLKGVCVAPKTFMPRSCARSMSCFMLLVPSPRK